MVNSAALLSCDVAPLFAIEFPYKWRERWVGQDELALAKAELDAEDAEEGEEQGDGGLPRLAYTPGDSGLEDDVDFLASQGYEHQPSRRESQADSRRASVALPAEAPEDADGEAAEHAGACQTVL